MQEIPPNHDKPQHPGYINLGYDQQGYGPPGYGEPGYDPPGYDSLGYDPPGYDQPGYGQPGYPQAGFSQPGLGQLGYGQPVAHHHRIEVDRPPVLVTPPTYMIVAVMTCVFVNLLFGILAVIFSCMSSFDASKGNIEGARLKGKVSLRLSIAGIILSIITVGLGFLAMHLVVR